MTNRNELERLLSAATEGPFSGIYKNYNVRGNMRAIVNGDRYPIAFVPAWDAPEDGEVEVTQADRDAAASGYYAWCSGNPTIPNRMVEGSADDHSMIQAFARHRFAAEEGKAELAKALKYYADTFCEGFGECVGDCCGKFSNEECSGCLAFATLARVRGEG